MLFQVYDRDGDAKMGTYYPSCIYPKSALQSMQNAGYYFKIDGKRASISEVLKAAGQKDPTPEQVAALQAKRSSEPAKLTRVRCVDDGKVFATQSEAARYYNIDPAQVSDSIKTGRPRSGKVFERCE